MILIVAVFIGLIAGLIRARVNKQEYRYFDLRLPVLVVIAFIPQFFGFFLPATRVLFSEQIASFLLISTQVLLLLFCLLNLKNIRFIPIFTGFMANFLVIVLNGGLMPISPETINRLMPNAPDSFWSLGHRLGFGKDIVLQEKQTKLPFFSDRFVTPEWLRYPVAFSFGDLLISAGVIWLLWSLGGPQHKREME
ncbi:MAG: DUF5317 family protein [Anaerolineaceae bacterium]